MTKTLAELEQIATDCMESTDGLTAAYHRNAGARARAAAAAETASTRRFNRTIEARELIVALEAHEIAAMNGDELTTAERLLVAAIIGARANGEPFKLELEGPTRVLVALEGGLVQGAVADRPGVSVITADYDTEGADAHERRAVPQDDGSTAEAIIGGVSCSFDPAFIDGAEAAEVADPAAGAEQLRKLVRRRRERGEIDPSTAAYLEELEAEAARLEALEADAGELTDAQGDPLRQLEPQA